MRLRLRATPEERARRAGQAIADHLARLALWHRAGEIALFASLPGEVGTDELFLRARRSGRVVLLPRMEGDTRLVYVPVDEIETLRRGRYGVREPPPQRPARDLAPDALVVVPGMAFDREGGRLGRGGGYYDRTLAALAAGGGRPRCVGIGFDLQIVEGGVPMTSRDVRMDAVVTESGPVFVAASVGGGMDPDRGGREIVERDGGR